MNSANDDFYEGMPMTIGDWFFGLYVSAGAVSALVIALAVTL